MWQGVQGVNGIRVCEGVLAATCSPSSSLWASFFLSIRDDWLRSLGESGGEAAELLRS